MRNNCHRFLLFVVIALFFTSGNATNRKSPTLGTQANPITLSSLLDEMKDHLGSNHVVLNGSGTLKQQMHYYPSGLPISDLSGMSYQRYMFQGKEFDKMHGLRWHDHGARFADNTILRWTTMDPLCEKYYDTSPYVFCGNNPIKYVDPNGKKIKFAKGVSKQFMQNFALAVQYLKDHKCDGLIAKLESLKETIYIKEISGVSSNFNFEEKTIYWDPYTGLRTTNAFLLSPTTALNHEVDHALQYVKKPNLYKNDIKPNNTPYYSNEEERVINGSEQKTAKALGEIDDKETTRYDHYAIPYTTKGPTTTEEDLDNDFWRTTIGEVIVKP